MRKISILVLILGCEFSTTSTVSPGDASAIEDDDDSDFFDDDDDSGHSVSFDDDDDDHGSSFDHDTSSPSRGSSAASPGGPAGGPTRSTGPTRTGG